MLVTGGAVFIGSILMDPLGDRYEFTLFRLKEVETPRSVVGDVSKLEQVEDAFAGQDMVVHLAADRGVEAAWDSALKNKLV